MLQKSKTSPHCVMQSQLEQTHYIMGTSSTKDVDDHNQQEFSLLCHDKQPFFLRLLQRDNSLRSSSWRKLAPSFVPFVWESSPGLPKPNWLNLDTANHDFNSFFIPPLAPPPMMHHQKSSQDQSLIKVHSAHDSSFASKVKTALRRSGRTAGSLFLINSSLSGGMARVDDQCSSAGSSFDIHGHDLGQMPSTVYSWSSHSVGSNHEILRPDHYGRPANDLDLRGKLEANLKRHSSHYQPFMRAASNLCKRNSSKIKGCWCFQLPECKQ